MGRRKIEIQAITNERNRSVTFLKRKNGLFKKAYELGVLCSVDIAVIIFEAKPGHDAKLYQYSSADVKSILQRHTRHSGEKDTRTPKDFSGSGGGSTKKRAGGDSEDEEEEEQAVEEEHDDADADDDDDDVPSPPPPAKKRSAKDKKGKAPAAEEQITSSRLAPPPTTYLRSVDGMSEQEYQTRRSSTSHIRSSTENPMGPPHKRQRLDGYGTSATPFDYAHPSAAAAYPQPNASYDYGYDYDRQQRYPPRRHGTDYYPAPTAVSQQFMYDFENGRPGVDSLADAELMASLMDGGRRGSAAVRGAGRGAGEDFALHWPVHGSSGGGGKPRSRNTANGGGSSQTVPAHSNQAKETDTLWENIFPPSASVPPAMNALSNPGPGAAFGGSARPRSSMSNGAASSGQAQGQALTSRPETAASNASSGGGGVSRPGTAGSIGVSGEGTE